MPTVYNKVTVNNNTLIDLSGDTVASAADIVAGKVGHLNDGTQVTGIATVGADVPIFTVTWDSGYTQVLSVTCNKTYAEISAGYYSSGTAAVVRETNDGSYYSTQPASMQEQEPTQGSDITFLVFLDTAGASYDIVCHPNGTFSATNPSSYYTTLNITENGTYQQQESSHQIIKQVNVSVPQPSGSISITQNGTVDVTNYASAVVNVPSGSSAWTKVAETSYTVSTTSTSTATVATMETGHSEIWTSSKWVYVRVRDTAGKRAGYFYGSDNFFYNVAPVNSENGASFTAAIRIIIRYSTDGKYAISTSTYGIFPDTVYNDGRIRIRQKYNSGSSLTINGTYKVEVYLLSEPDGADLFG